MQVKIILFLRRRISLTWLFAWPFVLERRVRIPPHNIILEGYVPPNRPSKNPCLLLQVLIALWRLVLEIPPQQPHYTRFNWFLFWFQFFSQLSLGIRDWLVLHPIKAVNVFLLMITPILDGHRGVRWMKSCGARARVSWTICRAVSHVHHNRALLRKDRSIRVRSVLLPDYWFHSCFQIFRVLRFVVIIQSVNGRGSCWGKHIADLKYCTWLPAELGGLDWFCKFPLLWIISWWLWPAHESFWFILVFEQFFYLLPNHIHFENLIATRTPFRFKA